MEPSEITIIRAYEIALRALRARDVVNPGPMNLQLKRFCEALKMAPEAFEVAARLSIQDPDEYFEMYAQIGRILDTVSAPVRVQVATLNTRQMSQDELLANARAEGAHAAALGKIIEDCPYNDAKTRTEWRHAFRKLRREMRSYSRRWVDRMRKAQKAMPDP